MNAHSYDRKLATKQRITQEDRFGQLTVTLTITNHKGSCYEYLVVVMNLRFPVTTNHEKQPVFLKPFKYTHSSTKLFSLAYAYIYKYKEDADGSTLLCQF